MVLRLCIVFFGNVIVVVFRFLCRWVIDEVFGIIRMFGDWCSS